MDRMRIANISSGGQISIPAEIRHRWGVRRVAITDTDDALVIRPLPDDPIDAALGSFRGVGQSSAEARRAAREDELAAHRRKGWA